MIAGLDLSTKRIGYASPSGPLFSVSSRAGAADPVRRLHELNRELEATIKTFPPRPRLIVLEDYLLQTPGRKALLRLGEIGGVVRLRLFELEIPFVLVRQEQLKRYATGNGGAKKPAMIEAALELGAPIVNDDEADAFLLRHLGRAAFGLEALELDHRREIVSAIEWPAIQPSEVSCST